MTPFPLCSYKCVYVVDPCRFFTEKVGTSTMKISWSVSGELAEWTDLVGRIALGAPNGGGTPSQGLELVVVRVCNPKPSPWPTS